MSTLYGAFPPETEGLTCRAGTLGPLPASRLGPDAVNCLLPAHYAGAVPVEASANGGGDFSSGAASFVFR